MWGLHTNQTSQEQDKDKGGRCRRHVVNLDRLSRWIDESGITLSSRGLRALSLKLEGHYWEGGSFSGVAPVEVRCAFVWATKPSALHSLCPVSSLQE